MNEAEVWFWEVAKGLWPIWLAMITIGFAIGFLGSWCWEALND